MVKKNKIGGWVVKGFFVNSVWGGGGGGGGESWC